MAYGAPIYHRHRWVEYCIQIVSAELEDVTVEIMKQDRTRLYGSFGIRTYSSLEAGDRAAKKFIDNMMGVFE